MTFDPGAFLNAVVALLPTAEGVQEASKGIPENFGSQVATYAALGSITPLDEASGYLLLFQIQVVAGFAYAVQLAEATAEDTLVAFVEDFTRKFYADRTLGGAIENGQLDFSLNNVTDYRPVVGVEFRHYIITIHGDQRETIRSV
jgi:hypothetical protein